MKSREAALLTVMTALTAATTLLIVIPFAPTRGFFNIGDAMVMFSGLLLGSRLGFLAGGIGSAIADIAAGFTFYAPLTLFIKGLEGMVAGIARGKKLPQQIVAVIGAAIVMLLGYFSVQSVIFGVEVALAELVAVNSLQVSFGAVISLALINAIRKTYPAIDTYTFPKSTKQEIITITAIAVILLTATITLYTMTGIEL